MLIFSVAFTSLFFHPGCLGSLNVRVTVTPSLTEKTYPDKMPLTVGLYLSEEFKNYRYTDSTKTLGTTYDFWNLGRESGGMFEVGLSRIFEKVVIVDRRPPFPQPPSVPLRAVVEPRIEGLDFKVPAVVVQNWSARIRYRILVYDLGGKVVWEKAITGSGEVPGSYTRTVEELGTNPAKPATAAIVGATDRMLEAFLASEEIKALAR